MYHSGRRELTTNITGYIMAERKVLNKHYPSNYDPAKIPKIKGGKNKAPWSIRTMAPFDMCCNNCREFIYKARKFNAEEDTVKEELYLGLKIYRFYIKCPQCKCEISFKTDLRTKDYQIESGATRNFDVASTMAKEKKETQKPERSTIEALEHRAMQSRKDMDTIERLDELKEMNKRQVDVNFERMLENCRNRDEDDRKLLEEEDEKLVRSLLEKKWRVDRLKGLNHNEDADTHVHKRPKQGTTNDKRRGTGSASTSKTSKLSLLVTAKRNVTEEQCIGTAAVSSAVTSIPIRLIDYSDCEDSD